MLAKSIVLGEKLAAHFSAFVEKFAHVGEIRGLGAMRGFTVIKPENGHPDPDAAKALVTYCIENGLIILATGMHGNLIRCLCPFTITDDQLEQGIKIIEDGLAAVNA